jgi:beta-lactam-binding protein with PASTA domain
MRVKAFPPLLLAAVASGCGGEARTVPDVVGNRLDVAQETLDDRGLSYETVGGGTFGIVVTSNWTVCEQEPAAGRRAKRVELVVARWCPPPAPIVPSLERLPLTEAEARLFERGIEPEITWLDDSDRYEAIVCEQSPPAGDRAAIVELHVAERCAL